MTSIVQIKTLKPIRRRYVAKRRSMSVCRMSMPRSRSTSPSLKRIVKLNASRKNKTSVRR